jgi:hypothetical protein
MARSMRRVGLLGASAILDALPRDGPELQSATRLRVFAMALGPVLNSLNWLRSCRREGRRPASERRGGSNRMVKPTRSQRLQDLPVTIATMVAVTVPAEAQVDARPVAIAGCGSRKDLAEHKASVQHP